MKKFRSVVSGDVVSEGLHEYRKYRGQYGFMSVLSDKVVFVTNIDGQLTSDELTEYKKI